MKINKKVLLLVAGIFFSIVLNAQTLFIPNGINGIGFSTTGNIGIGTNNTPIYKLQIHKDSKQPALMISGGHSGSPRIQTYGLDADPNAWMGLGTDMGGNTYEHSIYFPKYNGYGRLTIGGYNGITFSTNFTILENGNVGIGNSSPYYKLQVQKTDTLPAFMIGGGNAGSPRIQTYGLDADPKAWMGLGTDMSGHIYEHSIYFPCVNGIGRLTIGSYNGSSFNTKITALENGNVGIGTENPANKLDVNGTIRATAIKVVSESEWADFVFKPGYQLQPLSEVEQFISTNGHLPEIPTAKEVEKNGVNLGEMNAKLLQKVEELTLYLIEQKKEIELLKQKLAEISSPK